MLVFEELHVLGLLRMLEEQVVHLIDGRQGVLHSLVLGTGFERRGRRLLALYVDRDQAGVGQPALRGLAVARRLGVVGGLVKRLSNHNDYRGSV